MIAPGNDHYKYPSPWLRVYIEVQDLEFRQLSEKLYEVRNSHYVMQLPEEGFRLWLDHPLAFQYWLAQSKKNRDFTYIWERENKEKDSLPVDENGCHTLPNGDCVSTEECLHTPSQEVGVSDYFKGLNISNWREDHP